MKISTIILLARALLQEQLEEEGPPHTVIFSSAWPSSLDGSKTYAFSKSFVMGGGVGGWGESTQMSSLLGWKPI